MRRMDEQERRWLSQRLNLVTPLQRRILRLRFGLDGETPHSLAQVEQELQIDVERIRLEEADALQRIRR
jgi:DNA-directed RNA polymerase sigma subunit (sigma70/sigma32)